MTISMFPTTPDQADEWARGLTHDATVLAADLSRELEMIGDTRIDDLVAKVWKLHGVSFAAGRLTGYPEQGAGAQPRG